MSRTLARAALVASLLIPLLTAPRAAAATVTVDNLDGAGEGFNDPTPRTPVGGNAGTTLGAQRLIAFQYAASSWASLLTSSVEIRVQATFDPLPCNGSSAVLGQTAPHVAARDFAGAPVAGTYYPIALANALAGVDLDPTHDDIDAQFNSSFGNGCAFPGSFYYGLDANPPGPNDSDFVTVILHELCHGLGFTTFVDLPTGARANGFNDAFMLNLVDHSTGKLWPIMTDAERVVSSIGTGTLHWAGAGVVAAGTTLTAGRDAASGHVRMFAPNPRQLGSSVSHFDTVLTPNEVMEPIYTGPNHNPGLALAALEDLGWNTGTAPTTTTTTLPPLPAIDHRMCDKGGVTLAAGGTRFDRLNPPTRLLEDGFGTETCTIKREDFVCAPAEMNHEGAPANPGIHGLSYQIRCPSRLTPVKLRVVDRFNPAGAPIRLAKKINVLVPTSRLDLGFAAPHPPQVVPPPPPALTVDPFLCYKVAGPNFSRAPIAVTVQDQLYPDGYPNLMLYRMTKLCTPVSLNGGDPTAPGRTDRYACYQMKLPRGTIFNRTFVSTDNTEFGAQVMRLTYVAELCVPATTLPPL